MKIQVGKFLPEDVAEHLRKNIKQTDLADIDNEVGSSSSLLSKVLQRRRKVTEGNLSALMRLVETADLNAEEKIKESQKGRRIFSKVLKPI